MTRVAARRLAEDPVVAYDRTGVRTRVRELRTPRACGAIVDCPALRAASHTRPGHSRHVTTSNDQINN